MSYHMFLGVNLDPRASTDDAVQAFANFAQHLTEHDLLLAASPLQKRDLHPVLDTARDMPQSHFATMTFRDRQQADAAVSHFYDFADPTDRLHKGFIGLTTDRFFVCFEDLH